MNTRALWEEIEPRWREPLLRFMVTGEGDTDFEEYFDHCELAQQIVEEFSRFWFEPDRPLVETVLQRLRD